VFIAKTFLNGEIIMEAQINYRDGFNVRDALSRHCNKSAMKI
jgi:hypothetical protein